MSRDTAHNQRAGHWPCVFLSYTLGFPIIRSWCIARWWFGMSLPRGRGRIVVSEGRARVVARCPFCDCEHRYDKGEPGGEEIESVRRRGYTEEWLPCQHDLPGNYWRIAIAGGCPGDKPATKRRGRKVA